MSKFCANIFLIQTTSNYLWASEVFKNQKFKSHLFSFSHQKNTPYWKHDLIFMQLYFFIKGDFFQKVRFVLQVLNFKFSFLEYFFWRFQKTHCTISRKNPPLIRLKIYVNFQKILLQKWALNCVVLNTNPCLHRNTTKVSLFIG